MKIYCALFFFYFYISAEGQQRIVDVIKEATIAQSQAKLNRLELKNIIKSHNRTAEILCELDENKGNTYINSFHSSYIRLLSEIGNELISSKTKLFDRNLSFQKQNEIAKSLIDFNLSEIYKFSSDSVLYQVMVLSYGKHSRFEKATKFRLGLYNENSKNIQKSDANIGGTQEPDYISGLEIPHNSKPSMNGADYTIPIPKLNTSKLQLSLPFDTTSAESTVSNIKNNTDSLFSNSDSTGLNQCCQNFKPLKSWKIETFKEVNHKRILDRLSASASPSFFHRSRFLFSGVLVQSNFQVREGIFWGLSFSQQFRIYSKEINIPENFPIKENKGFSDGLSANFRINLNKSAAMLIEIVPVTNLKCLKPESFYPSQLIYGLRINPNSDGIISLDMLYYQNQISLRTNFSFKTKHFNK